MASEYLISGIVERLDRVAKEFLGIRKSTVRQIVYKCKTFNITATLLRSRASKKNQSKSTKQSLNHWTFAPP